MITAPTSMPQALVASTGILNSSPARVEMLKEALSHELHYELTWENFCDTNVPGIILLIVKDYQLRPIASVDVHSFRKADDDSFIVTAQRIVEQIESREFFRSI